MKRSAALIATLTQHDDLVAAHRRHPRVTVEVPWPADWEGGSLDAFVQHVWDTLAPGTALGPWVSLTAHPNAPYHVKLTAAGHGIACSSEDYGGVRGDATKTDHLLVHSAWMIATYEISDCTMSALRVEIHAPAAQLEAVAAVVRTLAAEAGAAEA